MTEKKSKKFIRQKSPSSLGTGGETKEIQPLPVDKLKK
jgi:hypothetical protein